MSVSIKQALQQATQTLSSESAGLDAELLLGHVLEVNRTWLRTWPEKMLSVEQFDQYKQFIERRIDGEPVAYILGSQEFWSLLLRVTPDTLIPRPDTELLVEQALEKLSGLSSPVVIDLGTGSGAIALAIASERPDARVIATDYSFSALQIARENAEQLGLSNTTFVNASWAECFGLNSANLIVSNPPYIEKDDPHLSDDVIRYEPQSALIADDAGLADIKLISAQCGAMLKSGCWLMFEHGWQQSEAVKAILNRNEFSKIETLKDLSGHDRVTIAQKVSN